jgi:hypothetical protein
MRTVFPVGRRAATSPRRCIASGIVAEARENEMGRPHLTCAPGPKCLWLVESHPHIGTALDVYGIDETDLPLVESHDQ